MISRRNNQKGITIVEFTLVASTVLLVIFAILEVGYFIFNMQVLNDLTRRTARISAVCKISDTDKIIELAFSEKEPQGFTSDNLSIEYLDINGIVVKDTTGDYEDIEFVKASVTNYDYGFSGILRFIGEEGVISLPNFQTILPVESFGVYNTGVGSGYTCK